MQARERFNENAGQLQVLLVDDQALFVDTLQKVAAEFGITLSGVPSLSEMLSQLSTGDQAYDLVMIDLSLPVDRAFDCLDLLRARYPSTKAALLTADARPEVIGEAINRHGAIGVVSRASSLRTLMSAVRFMVDGEHFVPASSLERTYHMSVDPTDLSDEEREIVRAIASGKTNQQIASSLGLEEMLVKGKTKTIYRKLGAHNRTKAAVIARSRGLI